jgi:LysR family transcriptional regulator, hydrogen peroxide-inducible genes activator
MNLRDLKYLVAVDELRHFGKAAEACFVSQPTLSGQLKKLEEDLGVVLFERSARSVVPTPVGERIVARARRVLAQAEEIEVLAAAQRDPLAGPLRVGAIHTVSPYLVPLFLGVVRERLPQMHFILHEGVTQHLVRELLDHKLDAALIATAEEAPELATLPLYDEPFWFAHAADHPYAGDREIGLLHLKDSDLLLLADGHCLTDQVLDLCRGGAGMQEHDRLDLRAENLETLIRLVGLGFGSTLVPALAVREAWLKEAGVVARPIPLPQAQRRVVLAYRRSFPRIEALQTLAGLIRERVPGSVDVLR